MKKLLLAAILLGIATTAMADVLTETFPDPLAGWTTRFMGLHSNLENYYVCTGNPDQNDRGNNPCGLWICDGNPNDGAAYINFDHTFGATVSQYVIGIMPFVPVAYNVYDVNGNLVNTVNINPDGTFPPCDNSQFSTNTPNGLGEFSITGGAVEGNTSIFNISATVNVPVPVEQVTWGRIKSTYH